MKQKIKKILLEETVYYDSSFSDAKLELFANQLNGISESELRYAVNYFRSQPGRHAMPKPADYISAIPDGHVSAQEAWAMMPRDEHQSVVWTEEMRMAYSIAAPLIAEKNINGAFFAFKEAYEKLVSESKFSRKKPQWSPSFGYDKNSRDLAILKAIEKKRISIEQALAFHPELEYSPIYKNILLNYNTAKNTNLLENKNKISLLPQVKTIK